MKPERWAPIKRKFVIPDLTADQKLLPISSVVLSSQRVDPSAAVFSAEKDKKLLAANPLVQDGMKLIPSVTRVFNKSQNMYVYLEAYQPAARDRTGVREGQLSIAAKRRHSKPRR